MVHSDRIVSLFTNAPEGSLSEWEEDFVSTNHNRVITADGEVDFSEKQKEIINSLFDRVFEHLR